MPTTRAAQLVLAFPLDSRYRFEDFVIGANAETVAALRGLAGATRVFRASMLVGPAGVGKTHLLQASCRLHGALSGGVIYLPLADPALTPAALEGLERCGLVALDDIECWLGDAGRERALLALYQGLVARGGILLAAAARAPAAFAGCYADLLSRLRACTVYGVAPPDDAGRAVVLRRLAAERGLELVQPVLDYWLARGPRGLDALIGQFERLDAAAMVAQRRITIPLLKSVLAL